MDKELLSLAAAAAAYPVVWCKNGVEGDEIECFLLNDQRWNPLEDDGDAFRLMVDLGLEVRKQPTFVSVLYNLESSYSGFGVIYENFIHNGNSQHTAVRAAITRAAAAMENEDFR